MRLFERALALALAAATVATVLFVSLNSLAPREVGLTFGLAFLKWALLYYGLGVILILLLAAGLGRALASTRIPRGAVALLGGGFLLATVVLNPDGLGKLRGLDGPMPFRVLAPLACLLGAAGLLVCAGLPLHRRGWPRCLGLIAPIAAAVAFLPTIPRRAPAPPPGAATGFRMPPTPLVFVGIDGADWQIMAPLLARGELPTLARLRREGAFGDLATLQPTLSPAIWNTMITGQPPQRHGIEGFTSLRVEAVEGALPRPRFPRGTGFAQLYRYLERSGRIREGPVVSTARRVPALWEIATAKGAPMVVVNWWATWPAEPVLGAVVSERVYFWRQAAKEGDRPERDRLTFPEDLYPEVRPLVMAPQEVTWEESRPFMDVRPDEFEAMRTASVRDKTIEAEFKYLFSMHETERRIALHMVESSRRRFGRPASLLVLFRIVDIACHRSLAESELVEDHLGASAVRLRKFGRVVSEAYRRADSSLGQILDAVGEANVVVASDHGFEREIQDSQAVYQHLNAPAGVFLARGPAIRPGKVEGLGVYDVMPLLAALQGLPVADDLPGRLREDLLRAEFLVASPAGRVASYGRRGAVVAAATGTAADEAALERLRALGYVK